MWEAVSTKTMALLDGVRTGKIVLDATAHPLGFIHAPLADRRNGSRLRLHLWPEEPFEPQSPAWFVHRHAWPLRSFVVRGRIRDRRYRVIEAADGSSWLYNTVYKPGRSVLTPSSITVCCSPLNSSIEEQGSVYLVPPDAFHASEALIRSVTVAESGVPTGIPPVVVGEHFEREVSYRRRKVEPHDLRNVAAQIIEAT